MAVIISQESAMEILKANRAQWTREESHNQEKDATVYDYYDQYGEHKFRVARIKGDYAFQVI